MSCLTTRPYYYSRSGSFKDWNTLSDAEFTRVVNEVGKEKRVLLLIRRDRMQSYVVFSCGSPEKG